MTMTPPRTRAAHAELDSPKTLVSHSLSIRRKPILRDFYLECYAFFKEESRHLPPGMKLELGSGGGFYRTLEKDLTTSDVIPGSDIDLCTLAESLPVKSGSIAAIYMLNVLHHVKDVGSFFNEAVRCLVPGGRVLLVEPANTTISRLIYRNFHHEPFEPAQYGWTLPPGGRLSGANGALPWIVFHRDRAEFQRRFPSLAVMRYRDFGPLRYLLSGGHTLPQLVPSFASCAITVSERLLAPIHPLCGMFTQIILEQR